MNKYVIGLALIIAASLNSYAQKSPVKFGKVDIEDLEMMVCPIDSNAGAMYLMDWGIQYFDTNLNGKFTIHQRIKIFNNDELDQGNIIIPHHKSSRIERLKASVYNLENGEIVVNEFDKKEAIDEDVTSTMNVKKLNLPNVKAGSIIELSYTLNNSDIYELQKWTFQYDIPSRHSEFIVDYPAYFIYKTVLSGYLKMTTVKHEDINKSSVPFKKSTFIIKNVPAFKVEPYLSSEDDYTSSVAFELEEVRIPGQKVERILPDSYAALSKVFYKSFSDELIRSGYVKDDVAVVLSGKETDEEKINALYSFLQEKMTKGSANSDKSLRQSYINNVGTTWQINALLTIMLREAGFDSYMVASSTTSNGKLHPFYPMASKVNYYLTYVKVGELEYVMDPSTKNIPFGMLPRHAANEWGMLVSEDSYKKVSLKGSYDYNSYFGNFTINETGEISGEIKAKHNGYSAVSIKSDIEKEGKDKFVENRIEKSNDWTILSLDYDGYQDVTESIDETMTVESDQKAEGLGDIIYVPAILFAATEENPFKLKERNYPISFGSSIKEILTLTITIPDGFIIDELPKPAALGLPGNTGKFIFNTSVSGNIITVSSIIDIKKEEYSPDEYVYIKALFDQIVTKHNEQIVLKKQ